jgi:hypothetical protein
MFSPKSNDGRTCQEEKKAELQFLETGIQTSPPSFFKPAFRNYLKNKILRNYNDPNRP